MTDPSQLMHNKNRRFINARLSRLVGINPGRWNRIIGICVHCTRSGSELLNGDDGPGTENWGNHPSNGGSFQDLIIFRHTGQQIKCTQWEKDEEPRWAAGYGSLGPPQEWSLQDYYLHVEVSQNAGQMKNIDLAFSEVEIESLCQFIAEIHSIKGFTLVRIEYTNQRGLAPQGICSHDGSANGTKLGKSDPGQYFPWSYVIQRSRQLAGLEDDMSAYHIRLVEAMARALTGTQDDAAESRLENWNIYEPGHERAGQFTGNSLLDGYSIEQIEQNQVQGDMSGAMTRITQLEQDVAAIKTRAFPDGIVDLSQFVKYGEEAKVLIKK